jgi:iron complex outermembrane receptor protein
MENKEMATNKGVPKLVWAVLLLLAANVASAEDEALSDITRLSLNDLMKMEVSSVSRKAQSLSNTAAAAFVVTQEDIHRSGATSIPEALREVPGLEVARMGSSSWAVSARGFNNRYAGNLLVLMDGRTIYTPLFSGVFWDLQDTLMEDIERIEVIRGPGAAIWGANAVNGVINIITKKTKDTRGNLAVIGAGNQERGMVGFRHGGALGEDGNYRVYGKGFSRDATVSPAGNRQNDTWQSGQLGFRLDRNLSSDDRLTLQGDTYTKTVNETVYPLTVAPPFNTVLNARDKADGLNLLARWEGNLANGSDFSMQTYYDRINFSAPLNGNTTETLDLDFQHRLHPNAHNDVVWGGGFRYIQLNSVNSTAIFFTPNNVAYLNRNAFVQDEIALLPEKLRLTLGAKLEKSYFGGIQLQPNARILWTPDYIHSLWAAFSKASSTPSHSEAQAYVVAGTVGGILQTQSIANPNLLAEQVTAKEIGYRTQWNSHLFSDVSIFYNNYDHPINWTAGAPIPSPINPAMLIVPLLWSNAAQPTTNQGAELSVNWAMRDWLRLSGTYSYLKMARDVNSFYKPGVSPVNHATLRCQMDFSSRSKLDLAVRHVNALNDPIQAVPAYTAVDARYAFSPKRSWELELVAQNLFSPQHLEFSNASLLIPQYVPSQIPRSIYAKASYFY